MQVGEVISRFEKKGYKLVAMQMMRSSVRPRAVPESVQIVPLQHISTPVSFSLSVFASIVCSARTWRSTTGTSPARVSSLA